MKPELKRIEATLHQLDHSPTASRSQAAPASGTRSFSFTVAAKPRTAGGGDAIAVQTFPADRTDVKTPSLPRLKTPSFSSHRHAANPALSLNLIKEIEAIASGWHTSLREVVQQIQELYGEGPIVDGWLESQPRKTEEAGVSVLRHAEVDALMSYVEEICELPQSNVTLQSPQPGYRLCGLDADGKMWAKPCPPEQVPSVGLAIARHQKLRQLLAKKRQLEARLGRLAKTLIVLHSHLQKQ